MKLEDAIRIYCKDYLELAPKSSIYEELYENTYYRVAIFKYNMDIHCKDMVFVQAIERYTRTIIREFSLITIQYGTTTYYQDSATYTIGIFEYNPQVMQFIKFISSINIRKRYKTQFCKMIDKKVDKAAAITMIAMWVAEGENL